MFEQKSTNVFAVRPILTHPSRTTILDRGLWTLLDTKLTVGNRLGLRILSSTSTKVSLIHYRLAMCLRLASQHRIWFIPGGYPGPGYHHLERRKLLPRSLARNTYDHRRGSYRDPLQHVLRQEATLDRRRDPDYSRLWILRDLGTFATGHHGGNIKLTRMHRSLSGH